MRMLTLTVINKKSSKALSFNAGSPNYGARRHFVKNEK